MKASKLAVALALALGTTVAFAAEDNLFDREWLKASERVVQAEQQKADLDLRGFPQYPNSPVRACRGRRRHPRGRRRPRRARRSNVQEVAGERLEDIPGAILDERIARPKQPRAPRRRARALSR